MPGESFSFYIKKEETEVQEYLRKISKNRGSLSRWITDKVRKEIELDPEVIRIKIEMYSKKIERLQSQAKLSRIHREKKDRHNARLKELIDICLKSRRNRDQKLMWATGTEWEKEIQGLGLSPNEFIELVEREELKRQNKGTQVQKKSEID